MNPPATDDSLNITRRQLLSLVRTIIGGNSGREDPENPLPRGPWDPIIRIALRQINVFGPHPEPWRNAISTNFLNYGDLVALNPQPLPPRIIFSVALAQTVISRAELMHEIATGLRLEGEERSIIIVSGRDVTRLIDELCGNNFKIRFPLPTPPPPWWNKEFGAVDFLVMATQFEQAASETLNEDLRQNFADASTRLTDAGLSRMQ